MENNEKHTSCSGHCENCNINQRTYCSAQKMYYIEQDLIELRTMIMNNNNGDINTLVCKNIEE